MRTARAWILLVLLLFSSVAEAHKLSDSYLKLTAEGSHLMGQWDVNLVDLDNLLGLDTNQNGLITWGEVRSKRNLFEEYFQAHIAIQGDSGLRTLSVKELRMIDHTDGPYATLIFDAGSDTGRIEVHYSALFSIDPTHRGLLSVITAAGTQSAVFSPERTSQSFDLLNLSPWHSFGHFVTEGIWHIWTGFDHLLFLTTLLLPCVLRWSNGRWVNDQSFGIVLRRITLIITSFTLAHSLTLGLSALGIVHLPSRWVEVGIAASILIPAINILRPFLPGKGWMIAMSFGLIHGFGFANVLADMDLKGPALVPALLGFNLGVEVGQLAIVGVVVPLFFALRGTTFYRAAVLKGGAVFAGILAFAWMVERIFAVNFLPIH